MVFRIIFLSLSLLTAIIITNVFQLGSFESTRLELKKFYEEEINACKIIDLKEEKYPGRGMYTLFQVDCKADYYPILLEGTSWENKAYFAEGAVIRKKADTASLELEAGGKTYRFNIRSVEDERDPFLIKYIAPLVLALFIIGSLMTILNWLWKF